MKMHFYSDPHLGVNRRANTTVASRKLLGEQNFLALDRLTQQDGIHFLLGDLFDSYRVSEEDIARASDVLDRVSMVLAGNHDVTNDRDAIGSLQLLDHLYRQRNWNGIVATPYGKHKAYSKAYPDNVGVWAIPHCTTQDLFEKSLQEAYDDVAKIEKTGRGGDVRILLLHCNYNRPEEFLSETELNLVEQDALALLGFFDHVILGHEHNAATIQTPDLRGVLHVVGNTFPTSFSDISDKRSLVFDPSTREMTSVTHWKKKDHHLEVNWKALPEDLTGIQFLDLTGKVSQEEIFEISEVVQGAWKRGKSLLAVRDSTESQEGSFRGYMEPGADRNETYEQFVVSRMPEDLRELFEEVRAEADS